MNILELNAISVGYGRRCVLTDLSIKLHKGECIGLIGHNGAGKSTLLKAIFGILPLWSGEMVFNGQDISKLYPYSRLAMGISYVPQGNRVFTELTVRENISVASSAEPEELPSLTRDYFPQLLALSNQRAGLLSGGEKQLLAMAMVFTRSPKLLLLDEPSLGLSPAATAATFQNIANIKKRNNLSVIIAEQKVKEVLDICDSIYALKLGSIAFAGDPSALGSSDTLRTIFL